MIEYVYSVACGKKGLVYNMKFVVFTREELGDSFSVKVIMHSLL